MSEEALSSIERTRAELSVVVSEALSGTAINYGFVFTDEFCRLYKHYKKRDPHLKQAFKDFLKDLDPERDGSVYVAGTRKVRMKSKSKGKSGSYRTVLFYLKPGEYIFMLDLYKKGDAESLTNAEEKEIEQLVAAIKNFGQQ